MGKLNGELYFQKEIMLGLTKGVCLANNATERSMCVPNSMFKQRWVVDAFFFSFPHASVKLQI